MMNYREQQLDTSSADYASKKAKIEQDEKTRQFQYAGEGITFFLSIMAGAIFVYQALRRQFRISQQQQNFMMAITHELKTPIAVTKLNLETLQRHNLDQEMKNKLIKNTVQEANRLNDLCNNMLLASQIEGGGYKITYERINFSALVQASANDYTSRFPNRIIEQRIEDDADLTGDQLLLQMVVNNLLDNAIKYSPKDATIKVTVEKSDTQVIFIIADTGNGIEDGEKKNIFKKFYRIGNEHTKGAKGTGLGLYLTNRIIKQHRGDISVTNNIPHGSIFKVVLPS